MSDITRDDLRVNARNVGAGVVLAERKLTDEEFDRLAREQGYVKLSDPVTADQLVMDAVVLFPAKVLRALLTDQCDCEDGMADGYEWASGDEIPPCPNCDGRGWLPKDGVVLRDRMYYPPHLDGPGIVIPADWLEANGE